MKNTGGGLMTLFGAVALMLGACGTGFSQGTDLVNFAGLANEGGTFAEGISGAVIDPVTISRLALGGSATEGEQAVLSDNTTVRLTESTESDLRMTLTSDFTFPTAGSRFIITFGADSGITASTIDTLTFTMLNGAEVDAVSFDPSGNVSLTGVGEGSVITATPTSSTDDAEFWVEVALPSSDAGVEMQVNSALGTNHVSFEYNVAMSLATVPEPGATAVGIVGLLGAVIFFRRARLVRL